MKNIKELVEQGVLSVAKQPAGNTPDADTEHVVLPLISEDYPAKTAVMWNSAYTALEMDVSNVMVVADPANIPVIFEAFRNDPAYLGGGAGVGFKDTSMSFLDEIDPTAKAIGSINFILKTSDGKLKGYNTDGFGYANSLQELLENQGQTLSGKKVVILGAGGTSNSIAFALAQAEARLVILNRSVDKAKTLAEQLNEFYQLNGTGHQVRYGGEDAILSEIADADVILNVSTKGAAGQLAKYSALAPAILPDTEENISRNLAEAQKVLANIPKTAVISDIILAKNPTPFMQAAMDAGYLTLDGLGMVVNQGVEAFCILHAEQLARQGVSKERIHQIMSKAANQ